VVGGVRGMLAPVDEIERVLSNKGITNQSKIIIYDNTTGKDRQ
jgi:3-mercaptopyruvate sulfurtransferase SseA